MRRAGSLLLLLLPLATGLAVAHVPECGQVGHVVVSTSSQRVEVAWPPVAELCLAGGARSAVITYEVQVFESGDLLTAQLHNSTGAIFLLSNDHSYAFVVTAIDANGNRGAPSLPGAGTPRFEQDLEYLAAGLIVTWGGLFAYATILARKEDRLLKRMEQIVNANLGRNPP